MSDQDQTKQQGTPDPKAKRTTAKRYRVVHDLVGDWRKGQMLTTDDLKDIDVQRLLDLKAIKVVRPGDDDDEGDEA